MNRSSVLTFDLNSDLPSTVPISESLSALTSYFWSNDAIRSRSVSDVVLTGTVDIPAPPARLTADWGREISMHLELEPGDVETLPIARTRMRWPDLKNCIKAVANWTQALGLQDVLAESSIALMACRGAKYHHDGEHYGSSAFCNLFLSEDKGLDLKFPSTNYRIPLIRGTVVIFDTCQPHAVIPRSGSEFMPSDFSTDRDCNQVFLSWELPIENIRVSEKLHTSFDSHLSIATTLNEEQVWFNGARGKVCSTSGRWYQAD